MDRGGQPDGEDEGQMTEEDSALLDMQIGCPCGEEASEGTVGGCHTLRASARTDRAALHPGQDAASLRRGFLALRETALQVSCVASCSR